jgi:hypothetical protein
LSLRHSCSRRIVPWPPASGPELGFKSGARNHLQANSSLGFCFEILI